ncbi:MAG: hypothetical protein ACE5J3_10220, partial [Methanosarcinales archaeon]
TGESNVCIVCGNAMVPKIFIIKIGNTPYKLEKMFCVACGHTSMNTIQAQIYADLITKHSKIHPSKTQILALKR